MARKPKVTAEPRPNSEEAPDRHQGLPVREYRGSGAAELADSIAVAQDLQHVMAATSMLHDMLGDVQQTSEHQHLLPSLWTSALVAYARCFTSGKRTCIDPSIFADLPGEPLRTHQCYIDTRNKHIAHPVNAFEEVKVGVVVAPADGSVGIAHVSAFRFTDGSDGVAQLGGLASHAFGYVNAKIVALQDELLKQLNSQPKHELLALPVLRMQPQGGAEAARTPRSQ